MTHELARAFKQVLRILQFGAKEEPDIDVVCEYIHIGECRIPDTCRWMPVVQQFPDIVTAAAHDLEPLSRDGTKWSWPLLHPAINSWVTFNGT